MFSTPFAKITAKTEKRLTYSLMYILVISLITMRYLDLKITNTVTPYGMVSFEFSQTLERAQEILSSWSQLNQIFAGISLGFDFLFLIIYTLFIALLIHKLNVRIWTGKSFYRVGELLIWSMFFTAILDTAENICLIKLLTRNLKDYWVELAFYFASLKFFLIGISIIYIVINFCMLLFKKSS